MKLDRDPDDDELFALFRDTSGLSRPLTVQECLLMMNKQMNATAALIHALVAHASEDRELLIKKLDRALALLTKLQDLMVAIAGSKEPIDG